MNRPWQLVAAVAALIAVQAAGVALAVMLAVGAARHATANTASVVQLCQAGNQARAEQVSLWEYVIGLPKPKGSPAEQARRRQEAAAFLVHLRHVFAPRDCSKYR